MKQINKITVLALLTLFLTGCNNHTFTPDRKTQKLNNEYYPARCQMSEENTDIENVNRSFIKGTELTEPIKLGNTDIATWDMNRYIKHMHGEAPATVHPNLWRMEKLNNCNGLYQVYPKPADNAESKDLKDGIVYQVRTYDISTMSIVKGKSGWIIIDPLNSVDAARKGWEICNMDVF